MFNEITSCRACNGNSLIQVLDLGRLFVSDFVGLDFVGDEAKKAPLVLVLCDVVAGGCGLLQLKHSVNPDEMYRHYYYWSGINESMKKALKDVTSKAKQLVALSSGDAVLDIGCNDGTLLRSYDVGGLNLVGIDPAKNLPEYARGGVSHIFNDYFNSNTILQKYPNFKAKVITAIAMFYDLENPNAFLQDIVALLDDDGVFIVQMADLNSMVKLNMFDNICHEHLEYYGLLPLRKLFEKHGLEIFDMEYNDVNGGSIRVYAKLSKNNKLIAFEGASERLASLEEEEARLKLYDKETYGEFAKKIGEVKEKLLSFIESEKRKGKKIYGYGASTKGNTLLQYFDLNSSLIGGIAERNPDKYGKKTIGSNIPILPESEVREIKPDYMLVLPWHFIGAFVEREQEFLNGGGKFIVPLPEFKLIPSF